MKLCLSKDTSEVPPKDLIYTIFMHQNLDLETLYFPQQDILIDESPTFWKAAYPSNLLEGCLYFQPYFPLNLLEFRIKTYELYGCGCGSETVCISSPQRLLFCGWVIIMIVRIWQSV